MTYDDIRLMLLEQAAPYKSDRVRATGITRWCAVNGVSSKNVTSFMSRKTGPGTDLLNALDLEWRIVARNDPDP